ncbi:MAG: 4Fe-4S dicluster domain-containing protein [Candidatus Aenigmarchaeota archaeon]|nr:4Fe-4S dicluster domain-containing protein [Candidatus Aenigmarchaeota archaeon]
MAVLINFKICDNSKDCSGIEVCPTNALYWNEKNETVGIDDSKCINCGKCEKACPVSAIRLAKSEAEYNKIKAEIDADPRKVSDLFTDRYGGQPIKPAFCIPQEKFDIQILQATQLSVVELFNDDSIECMVNSIPLKDLFKDMDVKYRKVEIKDNSLLEKYNVKILPSLLFFKNGKLIGKIQGYYDNKSKKDMMEQINEITSEK